MPAGRPKTKISEEDIVLIEDLASKGLNIEQIAHCMKISPNAFKNRREDNPAIDEAIKKGKAVGVQIISNALFENAKGGNVVAQIFFLKNRAPDEWKDRKENVHTGANGGPIEIASDIERANRLAQILNAARERGDRQAPH